MSIYSHIDTKQRVTTTSAMASPYRDQDGGLDADA